MWDVLLQNLPTVILVIVATIICGAELIKAIRVWREERQKRINLKLEEQQKEFDMTEAFEQLHDRLNQIDQKLTNLENRIITTENKIQDLTVSDMHDIKAWIVEQYHKFYTNQGWIDAFSADTIDKRYDDYLKEDGNSYVGNLIDQLHTLPMDPEKSRYKGKNREDKNNG